MNQTPEQKARDTIDAALVLSGWLIQDKSKINLAAGLGVAEEGHRLTSVEEQSDEYRVAKLKYCDNQPLQFVYQST